MAINSEIKNCNNYGKITAYGGYIGGIACQTNDSTIEKCANHAELKATGSFWPVAGIVSISSCKNTIKECANLNVISGGLVAGIVGNTYHTEGRDDELVTIENCYNAGKIEGGNMAVGICIYGQYNAKIKDSYNVGMVSCDTNVDAISCWNKDAKYPDLSVEIENVYYLDECCSKGNGTSQTEEQMQNTEFLKNLDTNIWTSDVKDDKDNWIYNNGYPILKWQSES